MGKKTHALTYWLWFVVIASLLHTLRDVLQFLAVDVFIANVAVKEVAVGQSIIWHPLNTVIIEGLMLFLALRALQKKNFGWEAKLTLVIALAAALGFAYYWFFVGTPSSPSSSANSGVSAPSLRTSVTQSQSQPAPTPFEFQELTIPYLRNRSYSSKLSELEQFTQTANYTSYLTSYDSDGFAINGLLTIPKGEQPEGGFPAVVFVHGYIPPTLYRTTQNYESYVNYLASRGIMVFKIDLRGHDQSEGEASGAYYSSDYVIDVLNAYAALEADERVNAQKIGLWGHSMAGNVLLRAASVKQTIPKVVIWAGAVYSYEDFLEFGIDDNSYRPPTDNSNRVRKRQQLMDAYGSFDSASWFWKQVAATNYLEGVETQIQLHHSVNDAVVSIEYSRNLARILKENDIQHQFFEYQGGGHNISGAYFTQAMSESAQFLLE